MQTLNDENLLSNYLDGDLEAFSTLYNKHKGGLFRYFLRQVSDKQSAEDLFQDCWGKVINNAHAFSPQAKFSTWLYTIARNQLIDQHRHLKVVDKVVSSEQDPNEALIQEPLSDHDDESKIDQQRKQLLLKICLQHLPHNLLDVFVLKEETNLTVKQIAEVVDASHEATKSRLRYACTKLRECITSKLTGNDKLGGEDEQTA